MKKKTAKEMLLQYKKMREQWFIYVLNRDGYLDLHNQQNDHLKRAVAIIARRSKEELAKFD